jgi:hypothetical protein
MRRLKIAVEERVHIRHDGHARGVSGLFLIAFGSSSGD